MQRLVSTIALVAVLGGLVGYIYYLETKEPAPPEDAPQKAFASVEADAIEELRITAGGETTRLTKTGDTWSIVEPVRADADAGEVSSITGSLSSLQIEQVVDEKPADLTPFGLEPARIDVAFKVKGQAAEQRILLGEKTPVGENVYAKLPASPRVFLVQSHLDATFNKTTFALRDKAVLKVDRGKADGLELKAGPTEIALAKSGESWSLVKPIAARADYAAVEGAIERLSSAQMQALAEDQDAPPSRYGLDAPDRDDDHQVRELERHADARQDRERRGVRQGLQPPGDLHGGADAPRRRGEGRRRVPPQGPLRLPLLHRHARRVHPRGPDAGVRPDEGQGRQGRVDGGRQDARCHARSSRSWRRCRACGRPRSRPDRTRR